MTRQKRTWFPGAAAHTICQFIDRRFYMVDDADRRALLDSIDLASDRWDWTWLSYAAMSSHLHYGHIAGSEHPERFFRSAHTRFAKRYHGRGRPTLGHVFANRPNIFHVNPAAVHRMVAYHHRNPVRAGVVERPSQSTWTSHRAYLRLDPAPRWLDVERALGILGFDDTAAGRRHFDEFVMEVDLDDRPPQMHVECVEVSGRDRREVDWTELIHLARTVSQLPEGEPLDTKTSSAARARRLIAFVATRDLGQTHAAVGKRLAIHPGSVCNLLARATNQAGLAADVADLRALLTAP